MNHPIAFAESLRRPLPEALAAPCANASASRFSTAQAVRDHHGRDESPFPPTPPDAVVFAPEHRRGRRGRHPVRAHKVPLIPFGAGSSLEGHLLAVQGGVSIDLSQMNKVLAINAEDLTATVQAGVTAQAAQRGAARHRPVLPDRSGRRRQPRRHGGDPRLGHQRGALRHDARERAGPDGGDRRRQGRSAPRNRAKKSSAGYDLTRLFVGSEGTLGVITEVTVRLYPVPEAMSAAVVSFPIARATRSTTVIQTIQLGVPIARSEFLCERRSARSTPTARPRCASCRPCSSSSTAPSRRCSEQAEIVQELAREHGGQDFEWATRPEDRTRLWNARHNAYFACLQVRPGSRAISTDTCVPISRLADSITGARRDPRHSRRSRRCCWATSATATSTRCW